MRNAVRYGVLFALAIFFWAVIETVVGLHDRYIQYHEYLSYFFAVPAVAILYWGIRGNPSQVGRSIGFAQAFRRGLGITGVVCVLCPLMWYVFCVWVNPDFLNHMAEYAVAHKGLDGRLAAKRFSLGTHLLVSTLSTGVIGVVTSLVIAVILAKQKRQHN